MANTVLYSSDQNTKNSTLVVFEPDKSYKSYKITEAVTQIGRKTDKSRADIMISSGIVSRMHGDITFLNDKYYYRDLDSTNGTYVNRSMIGVKSPDGKKAVELSDGDILSFDIQINGEHHQQRAFALFALADLTGCSWKLVNLDSSIAEIMVGRSKGSGLVVESDMFSEKHASFFCAKNGWAIIDHNSTNGVFINGKRLNAPRYLREYDVVRIIDTYFIFLGDKLYVSDTSGAIHRNKQDNALKEPQIPGKDAPTESAVPAKPKAEKPAEEKPVEKKPVEEKPVPETNTATHKNPAQMPQLVINIVERSVISRFKKFMLLQDINLSISNGEMVLILGGSGAGKTTFINAVMGYEKASGRIVYKNTNIYEEYEQMKYEIGFVPQQDLLRSSDTVYDTLENAADMKLPSSISAEEKAKRIDEVLEELGLTREKKSLVSKLSGGQKKRLSIAVEFISNPSLFFLDEPDSGLDGIMGRGLMENLRGIADKGTIVMIITHAPDRAADLFNKVIVLAKSTKDNCGHLAFFGSVDDAFKFFEVDSLEKIVKRINRPDENGEGLSDFFIDKYNSISK